MSNPAFIVDGFTEKNIIDKICPQRPIRRTDLNGKDVTLDAISNRLAMHIRLFGNKYYPIIIIIDREGRSQSCEEIITYLKVKLDEHGLNNEDIRISIADRMIENWLVAGSTPIEGNNIPKDYDGTNGTAILRKKLGAYSKATDCLRIIKSFSPKVAARQSKSFKHFINQIEDLDCWFTKEDFDIPSLE